MSMSCESLHACNFSSQLGALGLSLSIPFSSLRAIIKGRRTFNVPVVYMAWYVMVLRRAINQGIGRGGP
jgi:hypothetical protein